MEVVVKVEKLDDDDFENITMEEAQLSETILPLEYSLSDNGCIGKVEKDDTLILSNNIKSNLTLSEAIQPTPTVKPVSTNYVESSTTVQSIKGIYSPPLYKVMQELSSHKGLFIVRCCNCGRLLTSRKTNTLNLVEHMKQHHPVIATLYEKYKLEKSRKIKNLAKNKTNNSENVSSSVIAEICAELSVENLKKLEYLISERVQELVKETGFKELNDDVNDLFKIKRKNYNKSATVIQELQSTVRSLERECYELRSTVSKCEQSSVVLEKQLKILQNRLLQRKIIVKNIKISNRDQPIKEVEKYFKERLHLYNISIIGCNILQRSKTLMSNTETLLLELSNAEDCKLVVSKMHRLKRDNILVEHALSPPERKCREKLMMLRKELLSRNANLDVVMRKKFLLIKKNKFYWDECYGLCHDILLTVDNYEFTCADHIEDLTGIDLKEFLNILHKYDVE